jgi:predicted Zn-dependent protease
MKRISHKPTRKGTKRKLIIISFLLIGIIVSALILLTKQTPTVFSQSLENNMDSALYRREEFFGSQAIVPIPTAEAYENLLKLKDVNNPKVFVKLAELSEKLEKFDEAEKYLIKADNLDLLANFYHRRGTYEKEAEIIAQILKNTKRLDIFERLIQFAQFHELNDYLQPEYFQQVADDTENALPIIEKLIDKLVEENQKAKALEIIRNYKPKFPEPMLEKEVSLLSSKEAEAVYYQAFDPFWSDVETENFYQFLSDNDRLRAYGSELKTKFRQNPADYQTAIRLIHYKQYDYNEITPIVLQLEKAKKDWKADELLTIARLLLKSGNGDLASKFLYTLQVRNELTPEMRSEIAYQIFKILCDAGNEKLSLTKANLDFYRDVGSADSHPGITTGILSLIFSDTDPAFELDKNEQTATKLFNRAAAYRVFQNYKKEFPNSPEIGQMYLDLIRIYTNAKDADLAEKLLNELAEVPEKSNDFPRVAMNLADAFVLRGDITKERQTFQKIMDFLGKEGKFGAQKKKVEKEKIDEYSSSQTREEKYDDLFTKQSEQITYNSALSRYVESLSKEKKITEILEVYSNEIAKYPEQEWLYEQRASWLEQTNLFDEQLKIYKATLEKFPNSNWRDKLARWFIRNKKQAEFEVFSTDLVGKLNDEEVENYLSQFVTANDDFSKQMYLKLYQTAHQRFPHNITIINTLLQFYKDKKLNNEWRNLAAEYYFESAQVREEFLGELAKKGELQSFLNQAGGESIIYELFRADANSRLSHYEEALQSYRKLNALYPNESEFSNHLVDLTRSFGQKSRQILSEAANLAQKRADFEVSNTVYRTESGEINTELNDYKTAKNEWQKLIETGKGSSEIYLETAEVFWDYYQYQDALQMIQDYRIKSGNKKIYAFEAGAVLESLHKQNEAVFEYVNALENEETGKTKRRLEKLANNDGLFETINATFQKQKKEDYKTLQYADVLRDLEKNEEANAIVRKQILSSKDVDFLETAGDFSDEIRPNALIRLAELSTTSRKSISYCLQLADFYRENEQPDQAKRVLVNLQQKYPTNYGVLRESADFYWSMGANDAAIQVLQNGFDKAKGDYRFAFASRLAKRFISLNRLPEAERYLVQLHQEKPTDSEVFHELANVYIREGKSDELREKFAETIKALKTEDYETNQLDDEIAGMRREMITAFTQLKDYHSAVEQYIEIINREPDEDENLDAAIRYVKRYGNADLLLSYYQKTAAEAFKNYRWNVVLAKIFEANGDTENAVKNYQKAIDNQPEMTELYAEIVRIEIHRKNYAEALRNLDQIIELSGEDKNLIKQKVQLLQLLGKNDEAKTELAKIPNEAKPIIKPENQFSEAERTKSVEMFREAFTALLEEPLENELKAENITSYVNTLRQEENLDVICERLFLLREKLIYEAEKRDSKLAGEARNRLQVLQNTMSQSVGNIAKTVGTDEELEKVHNNLNERIEAISNDEQSESLTFLQDFSARCGFGDLVEKALIKRGNKQELISFYNERGAFQKILEIAEAENNLPLIAENAKLLGNSEKELNALRQVFQDKNSSHTNISRYLQIIDRAELEALSKQNSPHQIEVINFLLEKGERELVHQAIENSDFAKAWKLSRNAETSLALKELDQTYECYFCDALKFGSIGEFIIERPDKNQHLIGKDWFRLTREYGEWLDAKKEPDADKFLVAMTENAPTDAVRQTQLGVYYLAKNDLEKANEHFQISLELDGENAYTLAKSGETLYRLGEKQKAEEIFDYVLNIDVSIYIQTLTSLGLQRQGQEKIHSVLVSKIDQVEDINSLVSTVAQSFNSESEKANYFLKVCNEANDKDFIGKLLGQNVIAKDFRQPFYEILSKSHEYISSDYEFEEISRRTFSTEDAEEIYDHEKDFKVDDEDSLKWQHEYLSFLIEKGKDDEAKRLILQLENELKGKNPRPLWLRLAHLQIIGGSPAKFVGIEVTDNISEIKPPSVERLNGAVAVLKNVKREAEAEKLTLDFYARMLALEQYETANFIGLSRQLFKLGKSDDALKILDILVNFEQEERRAELSQMRIIKEFEEETSSSVESTQNIFQTNSLSLAAELCEKFQQTEISIKYRQKLVEVSPIDAENKFKLAELLPKENAVLILQSIVSDRNSLRNLRWKAIWKLYEFGEINEVPNNNFDAYSQFYNGNPFNSLILDKNIEAQSLQQLITVYANSDKLFAALKVAEIDKSAKNDELLNLLSKSAQKVGEFGKAIKFEKAKSKVDEVRIKELQNAETEKNKPITDFTVDGDNTRKL